LSDRLFRCAERDDLDGGDHLPGFNHGKGRQGTKRDSLVDEIEPVDAFAIEDEEPARLGKEIGPAGERHSGGNSGSDSSSCYPLRRLVLADILGIEPRDGDCGEPGGGDHADIGTRQHSTFFERSRPELQAVGEDRTFRLVDGDLAKPHAASARSPRRSVWVI
jgi:hypothetical protein